MTEETDNKIIITETIVEEIEDNMIMIITETTDKETTETTETTKEDNNRTETTLETTEENNHKENQHLSMLGIWTSILMNRL